MAIAASEAFLWRIESGDGEREVEEEEVGEGAEVSLRRLRSSIDLLGAASVLELEELGRVAAAFEVGEATGEEEVDAKESTTKRFLESS